jgi:hypothetical protein
MGICVTKRAAATRAQVCRNIDAARLKGLRIAGIRPDGTIVTYEDGNNPFAPVDQHDPGLQDSDTLRWGDARE